MSAADIFCLPLEVVEIILNFLPTSDILHFSQTCRSFRRVIDLQGLWMRKSRHEWPDLKKINKNQPNWFKIYKDLQETKLFCWEKIKKMSAMYFWKEISLPQTHIEHFFNKSKEFDGFGYIYITLFLKQICTKDIYYPDEMYRESSINMTYQYYAAIILDYLVQYQLSKNWVEMQANKKLLVPEKILAFLSQWIEPKFGNCEAVNNRYFTRILQTIELTLPPNHPFHKVDKNTREKWATQLLDDNNYSPHICREIIKLVRNVLTRVEGLISNDDPNFNTMIYQNVSCRRNSNSLLSPIYFEAILRRFGIRCEIMFFYEHRLLIWRENWAENSQIFLIDPFQDEIVKLSETRCPYSYPPRDSSQYCYNPTNLLFTLTSNVKNITNYPRRSFKNAVELLHFLEPQEIEHLILLSNIYLDSKKEIHVIRAKLANILEINQEHDDLRWRSALVTLNKLNIAAKSKNTTMKKNVKIRSSTLKYAVGMVCFHKVYGYLCVIRGWDNICSASQEWKVNMGIHMLKYGENQPFYQVVAVDYSNRYVAEENLVYVNPPPRLKDIEEILAVDFSHFNGYYYIPNAEKQEEYPGDMAVRLKYSEAWR